MTPLRIGLLGAARITPLALLDPARATALAQVTCIAARDTRRAEAFAAEHGIAEVVDDYAALVAHPQVDAIYNALPPAMHAELTVAALRAGKPVLCEKPFAMNAVEAATMVEAGRERGVVLMEAFHYRYHPLFARVLARLHDEEIGSIVRLRAAFKTRIPVRDDEIRYRPELGGGALLDLGTYCLHWVRTVMGAEPQVVHAHARFAAGGADVAAEARLRFPNGVMADIACAMDAENEVALEITGERGVLRVRNPLCPQFGHSLELERPNAPVETERLTLTPTYDFQLAAFIEAVRGGAPPLTSGADSVAQMALLDDVREAAGIRVNGA